MRKIFSPLLFCFLLFSSVLIVNAATVNLTLTTDKTSYARLDTLTISGSLTKDGLPVTDGLVAVQIDKPNGDPLVLRTVNTGENPTYPDPINNPDFLGQVLNLYLSDANKNPLGNVNSGSMAYFTLTLHNLASTPEHIVVSVNVFDNDNVPIGISTPEIGELPARSQSTVVVGIPIPASAASGRATVFASMHSDLPENGGKPFSLEASAVFTINGVQGGTPPSSGNGSQGDYSLSFTLPPKCPVGTCTIYTCAAYSGIADSASTVFNVYQPGDLTGDGIVNFDDLLAFIDAYVLNHNPPFTLTPKADFDDNGVIDFEDVLLFVDAYVLYWAIP